MFSYSLNERMEQLLKDGNQLLEKSEEQDNPAFAIRIWLAAVSDTLKPRLRDGSTLLDELKKVQQSITDGDENYNRKQLEKIVLNTTCILEYARKLPQPDETSSELYKAERNRLEREIRYFISEQFLSSWWFRIPVAILALAVVFAVTGAIQIQGYAISVQDITDKAIERARQDIQAQAEGIISGLQAHSEAEKNRITAAANNHIETLKQQETPDVDRALSGITTNIDNLNSRLAPLEGKTSNLENRLLPLEQALDVIDQDTKRGLLEEASFILKTSTIVIWAVIGLSLLGFLFSLFALWKVRS